VAHAPLARLLLGFPLLLAACEPCVNTVLQTVPDPSQQLQAVVFQRDCGATTAYSTQVSILPVGARLPNDGGNTFVADVNPDAAAALAAGTPEITVQWLAPDHLEVRHYPGVRIFRSEEQAEGVRITYQQLGT
jgi:hypothetical protein